MTDPAVVVAQPIGRIRDHAADWFRIDLESSCLVVKPDEKIRFKWHPDAEYRNGEATVFAQIEDQVWLRQPLFETVPAACDRDYVYLVEE